MCEAQWLSQVMVRATHAEGGEQAFFLARVADGAAGARSAVITSQALAKQMGPVSGRADLALVVGDPDVDNPTEWDFAQVRHRCCDEGRQPLTAFKNGTTENQLHNSQGWAAFTSFALL